MEVDICLPVSVLIKPDAAANAGYSIALEAEQAVLSALSYNVTDSVLLLGSTADFVTSRPIKVTGERQRAGAGARETESRARQAGEWFRGRAGDTPRRFASPDAQVVTVLHIS